MVRDKNFVVELVCRYMNSTTYQKFFVHDRVPLRHLWSDFMVVKITINIKVL